MATGYTQRGDKWKWVILWKWSTKNSFPPIWFYSHRGSPLRINPNDHERSPISSEPNSICYIQTSNLDGETNLKVRQVRSPFRSTKTARANESCIHTRAYRKRHIWSPACNWEICKALSKVNYRIEISTNSLEHWTWTTWRFPSHWVPIKYSYEDHNWKIQPGSMDWWSTVDTIRNWWW